jgi:hypothetical protein
MGHKRTQQEKQRNLVAKHARKYNTARVFRDRKKDARRGYNKHRGATHND